MVQEPDTTGVVRSKLLGRVFRHLLENAARYSRRKPDRVAKPPRRKAGWS